MAGRRVVVCRAEADAGTELAELRHLGADVVLVPLVDRAPPRDGGVALRAAVDRLDRYHWLAVTSAAGVTAVVAALAGRALPPGLRVAAVGPATAAAGQRAGLRVDLVPPTATAAHLATAFPAVPVVDAAGVATGPAVLAPLAEQAGDDLVDGLRAKGYRVDRVDAYRLDDPGLEDAPSARELAAADAVLFSAPSVVDRFLDRFGLRGLAPVVVCIGPRTAERAREHGVSDPVVAQEHTGRGLVAALVARVGSFPTPPPV